jgi:hypothetical protein
MSTLYVKEASKRRHVYSDTSTFKARKLLKGVMFVQIRVHSKIRKFLKGVFFVQIRVHRPPGHRRGDHAAGAQQLG